MKASTEGTDRVARLALAAPMGAAKRQSGDARAGNRLKAVRLGELTGGVAETALLLTLSSAQGKWHENIRADRAGGVSIGEKQLSSSAGVALADIPIGDIRVGRAQQCTGRFFTPDIVQGDLGRGREGASGVIAPALVRAGNVLNVLVGNNQTVHDPDNNQSWLVTLASPTTKFSERVAHD